MTPESIASAQIDEMLADIGKTRADYEPKPDSAALRERFLDAALEWVYDQTCATALAAFEDAAAAYTGKPINDEG